MVDLIFIKEGRPVEYIRAFSPKSLKEMLEDNGFEVLVISILHCPQFS
jgi:hypothetical protein